MTHGRRCLCRNCLRVSYADWQEIEDEAARQRAHVEVATRRLDTERERYQQANSELARAFSDGDDAQTRATVKP